MNEEGMDALEEGVCVILYIYISIRYRYEYVYIYILYIYIYPNGCPVTHPS